MSNALHLFAALPAAFFFWKVLVAVWPAPSRKSTCTKRGCAAQVTGGGRCAQHEDEAYD